ncbi:MAG: hypothetical protein CMB80_20225 [Flammeovirgaceae bacterium]|nr:hypothetical protein [Flammeovirgaceae bacterium]MBE61032.1 hypothetical protein [Flammeovirgaceae bacterium]
MKSLKMTFLAAMLAGTTMFYSCSDDSNPEPEEQNESNEILISSNSQLGNVITDGNGVTLYFYSKDASGESACLDGCLDKWPIFYLESPELASGLEASDFSSITHSNGELQTTYKGWPLYYFSPSGNGEVESSGATAGEGVGGVWYVAKPDYSIMIANTQLVGNDGQNYTSSYEVGEESTAYFVDSEGNTLYAFAKDYKEINTYTAADLSNNSVWPIFEVSPEVIPSVLSSGDFGTIEVSGKTQMTYKGWPLYYFGQDASRGDTKGVSVPAPGVWPIVNQNTEEAVVQPTIKTIEHETLGEIMVDAQGRTLYFFTKDVTGNSTCAGGCLNAWPVFYSEEIVLPNTSQIDINDFGTTTATDGSMQTTYKGWPLYYYSPSGDGTIEDAGETLGEGVGSVWFVAKTGYSLMIGDAQLVGSDGNNYLADYTVGDGTTKYFTDAEGNTLYIFINDSKDKNNYTKEDFSNNGTWPIFYIDITELPSLMNAEDFGEIEVHGEKQLTFKGWPVYYFGGDSERGQTKGVSVPSPGVWPIINNDTELAK